MGHTRVFESEEQFTREVRTLFKSKERQPPFWIFYDSRTILEMPGVSNEAFLAACLKNQKEKFSVDFDAVAKLCGLSKGGAQNKFRALMNADDGKETVPSTPKLTKRKASQIAGGGGTTDGGSEPARKKTKSVDKEKVKDAVTTTTTDAPVSRKATPAVATDAPDNPFSVVDGTKTGATGATVSREATPVVATVSTEEDPTGTGSGATTNNNGNPVMKKGVARRVKKEVATKGDTPDAEGDSPGGDANASDAKLGESLDTSHAEVQVFKKASSHL